jgi:hypothetical protein
MFSVTPAPNPTPSQAFAPDLGRRFTVIVAAIAALVAYRFLHDPRFKSIIIPLWIRLTRTARRFERLMARVAANRASRPRLPRPHRPKPATARPIPLPTGFAWLLVAIPYEAASYASQLEALLTEPGVADFLAAHPAAGRILRPLGHMLGIRALAPKRIRPKRTPQPESPQAESPQAASPRIPPRRALLPKLHPEDPFYRPSAQWPRGPWPATNRRRPNPA